MKRHVPLQSLRCRYWFQLLFSDLPTFRSRFPFPISGFHLLKKNPVCPGVDEDEEEKEGVREGGREGGRRFRCCGKCFSCTVHAQRCRGDRGDLPSLTHLNGHTHTHTQRERRGGAAKRICCKYFLLHERQ